MNVNIYTDTTPYVYLIDNSIVFKRYKKTLSTESGTGVITLNNMLSFYNSWRGNSLTPEAVTEALPNYTALIADSTLSIVLPIVRSNYNSRVAGNANDIVVIYINSNIDYSNTILLYFLEVAKYYSSRAPKMQFYSINLSLNELPELNIDDNSYLPAIKIYSKRNNKASPYDFHDDISNYVESVANFKAFIEKYKFHPLISN